VAPFRMSNGTTISCCKVKNRIECLEDLGCLCFPFLVVFIILDDEP